MGIKSLVRLSDYSKEDIGEIFQIADRLWEGKFQNFLHGKTIVMFFPSSSIRTRIAFEKGIYLLGGQTILFPPEALEKKEAIKDVVGYLNNWADTIIVRHKHIQLIDEMHKYADVPVINAMTEVNHPCEMLADMYALSKIRADFQNANYLFCGARGNIGLAWKEAADVMGLTLEQCCPKGYEIEGITTYTDIREAVKNKDVICTDSVPESLREEFERYKITKDLMKQANTNVLLNPCPPFYRNQEVAEDVIESDYFVGYEFKKYLLQIQQALVIFNLI